MIAYGGAAQRRERNSAAKLYKMFVRMQGLPIKLLGGGVRAGKIGRSTGGGGGNVGASPNEWRHQLDFPPGQIAARVPVIRRIRRLPSPPPSLVFRLIFRPERHRC
jgi:hypothetical protein